MQHCLAQERKVKKIIMDEIKLKILCILEEKAYQKVGVETIQKELSGIDLYRHLTYLEQKQLIRVSKIGPLPAHQNHS